MKKKLNPIAKFRPLWEGGKSVEQYNIKVGYKIRLFCINELNNLRQKNPIDFGPKETDELLKMIMELRQDKQTISTEDLHCELEDYEEFLGEFFRKIDYEDRYGKVTIKTVARFRVMSCFIDVLASWGAIDDEMIKCKRYCQYKAVDIFKSLKKGEIPRRGGPKEQENCTGDNSGLKNEIEDLSNNMKNANIGVATGSFPGSFNQEPGLDHHILEKNPYEVQKQNFDILDKMNKYHNNSGCSQPFENSNFNNYIPPQQLYQQENTNYLFPKSQNESINQGLNQRVGSGMDSDINNTLTLLHNEKNKLMEELNIEKDKVKKLTNELNFEKQKNIHINNTLNSKIIEIQNLKNKLDESIENCKPGEKIFSLLFLSTDHKVRYPISCKNTYIFVKLEEELYNAYPEYKEVSTFFTVGGAVIKRFKSIQENNIKNHNEILLNIY